MKSKTSYVSFLNSKNKITAGVFCQTIKNENISQNTLWSEGFFSLKSRVLTKKCQQV